MCMIDIIFMLVQGVLPMVACPCHAKFFISFHVVLSYYCIFYLYDYSAKSCLGTLDLNPLEM